MSPSHFTVYSRATRQVFQISDVIADRRPVVVVSSHVSSINIGLVSNPTPRCAAAPPSQPQTDPLVFLASCQVQQLEGESGAVEGGELSTSSPPRWDPQSPRLGAQPEEVEQRRNQKLHQKLHQRPTINSDGGEPTSSERRPDDPAYGLDPVVHVRLGVGHEQEGLMADWCAVLLSGSTCDRGRETGEIDEGPCRRGRRLIFRQRGRQGGVKPAERDAGHRLIGSLEPQRR